MKTLTKTILASAILLAVGLRQADAALTMRLSADGGATWTLVTDNGPLDANPVTGFITYTGPIGDWAVNITSGFGAPLIGDPTTPHMDVSTLNFSTQPENLIVQMSDTGFLPSVNQTFIGGISGFTAGTVTYTAYRDSGNIQFGTTSTYSGDAAGVSPSATAAVLFSEGPYVNQDFGGSNSVVVPNGAGPFSLTLETVVVHTTAGQTDTDALLYALPPPPCNCTLTFLSPASITNCAADVIPDVTAMQDCGSGSNSVLVTFVGAVTNGVCPAIITRTNSAVDGCGAVHTFVQTITVNCAPNCTITPSVTTVVVGKTGLQASVADAGAGANYYWTVDNGTITGGQGTTNLTWTAGLDSSKPATICVTVSTAAGCMSKCCTTVPLLPCRCTVTFLSPSAITNCMGDIIPPVLATEDCGGGASPVTVSFLGAVTNGSCPQIITRTNGVTDDCGKVCKFVQTITLNCRGNICGHIFADCDGSGDLTKGDVGLSKVVVSLLDASNHVVMTQTTDANGGYCFIGLSGGNYTVSVTPPSGYSQTAASTGYHWKDSYGRVCWQENDGYVHCLNSGTECWSDKNNCSHWKDNYGRDCWKDNWGSTHYQQCGYQTCNAQTNNNKISVSLTNCTSRTDVDFAYTGNKAGVSICVSAPSYVKCGQTCTYTCTVTNTGNACFTGGTVCHVMGNCGWYGWSNCTTVYDNCPPLSPGQSCTFTHKCTYSSWNCGTVGCQSSITCSSHAGNASCQSSCSSQCGW